jgi:hypothetical protein
VFQKPWPIQCLVGVALIPLSVFGCVGCFGHLPVFLIICYEITSSIGNARDSGAFDALLITPTDDRTLTRGLISVYVRRGLLFLPVLAVLGIMGMGNWFGLFPGPDTMARISNYAFAFGACLAVYAIVTPLVTLLFYVVLACWASTFRFSPVGQTCAATGILLGITIGVYIFTGIVSGVAMLEFEALSEELPISPSGWGFSGLFLALRTVFPGALAIGTLCVFAYVFYQLFAHHLATLWRTGGLPVSRPAFR